MSYENIETPTSEVDKLYREIVADYKAGKYKSQEEALAILDTRCFLSSIIDIKEELLSGEFKVRPFYYWGTGGIDGYMQLCEKLEATPPSKEHEILVEIVNDIIKGAYKSEEAGDNPELMRTYDEMAQLVWMQVDKICGMYRKNRKAKNLYEKYRAEIEAIPDAQQQMNQNEPRKKPEYTFKPALMVVFSHFRQFQQDYEILKSNGYITETAGDILKWEKSKVSLSQYFGTHLHSKLTGKNQVQWKEIEILFDVKGLKNSHTGNNKKLSKDLVKLQKILSKRIPPK